MRNSIKIILLVVAPLYFASAQNDKSAIKLYEKLNKYYENFEYDKILEQEEKILDTFTGRGDTLEAVTAGFLAEAYENAGDYQAQLDYMEKELNIRREIPGDEYLDLALQNTAYAYLTLGDYEKSALLYEEFMEKFEREGKRINEDYIYSALDISSVYTETRRFREAEKLLKNLSKKLDKDHPLYPTIYNNMAYNYAWAGNYSKAEKHYLDALELTEEQVGTQNLEYISILANYAELHFKQATFQTAEKLLLTCLDIYERSGTDDPYYYANILSILSSVYVGFSDYEKSIEIMMEEADIRKKLSGEKSFDYANSLYNMAYAYYLFEDYKTALSYFDKSIAIYDELGDVESDYFTDLLTGKALVMLKLRDFEEAEELMTEALDIKREILGEDHPNYATALTNLGKVKSRNGNIDVALELMTNARKIRNKKLGKYHPKYAETTNQLAILNWNKEKFEDAERHYQEVFDNYFEQIDAYFPVLSENEKAIFYNTKLKKTFEEFNSYAVERAQANPSLIGKIYDYQLATKALIMYATNKVRESIMSSGDTALINKYISWVEGKERLSKLFSMPLNELEDKGIDIEEEMEKSNRLEKELSELSTEFSETFVKQNLTWEDVRNALGPDEAAIEVIRFRKFEPDSGGYFSNEIYYAALIVKNDTEHHPEMVLIGNGSTMETRYLANYRNSIKFKIDEQYSYKAFWQPIAEKIEDVEKVYFSPDGIYNQVSVFTLRNPETDNYLIDEKQVQLVTNTKDIIEYRKRKDSESDGKAYLFGFPNYNKGMADLNNNMASNELRGGMRGQTRGATRGMTRGGTRGGFEGDTDNLRSLRGSGLSRGLRGGLRNLIRGGGITMLPGTKREVEYIAELYENLEVNYDTLLHDRALEENIKEVDHPKSLHIATHGFFIDDPEPVEGENISYMENPLLRSGLILAGANRLLRPELDTLSGQSEDGILTAYEAMNLNLDHTELVVLSACETGLGEIKNGEGVYGLQRAFLVAGAKSLIMSLWSVDDDATQELMNLFYDEWLHTGNKQESFRKAQQQLKYKYKKPFYWGAFVMVGE
jgi:CHAT domain-containing protein